MNVNFSGQNIYKSRLIKKGLEVAADNGTLFVAGTSLVLSTFIRPLSILATPNTDKENKKLAFAKSISSSAGGYLLMLGASLPIARSIKRINKNPIKYLKPETIKNFKELDKPIEESKAYQFVTQVFKLGVGFTMAAPKAIMTCALIPSVMTVVNALSKPKTTNNKNNKGSPKIVNTTPNKNTIPEKQVNKNIAFKGLGNSAGEALSKAIGKTIDKPFIQKMGEKFKNSNFGMHMIALTDALTTGVFIQQTRNNKNIEEKRKKTLCYNAAISTTLGTTSGYVVDRLLEKPTAKFIKNFSEANKDSVKLSKYIQGIKIAKPALILGGIYYIAIPFVSTFLADRIKTKQPEQPKQETKNIPPKTASAK